MPLGFSPIARRSLGLSIRNGTNPQPTRGPVDVRWPAGCTPTWPMELERHRYTHSLSPGQVIRCPHTLEGKKVLLPSTPAPTMRVRDGGRTLTAPILRFMTSSPFGSEHPIVCTRNRQGWRHNASPYAFTYPKFGRPHRFHAPTGLPRGQALRRRRYADASRPAQRP